MTVELYVRIKPTHRHNASDFLLLTLQGDCWLDEFATLAQWLPWDYMLATTKGTIPGYPIQWEIGGPVAWCISKEDMPHHVADKRDI